MRCSLNFASIGVVCLRSGSSVRRGCGGAAEWLSLSLRTAYLASAAHTCRQGEGVVVVHGNKLKNLVKTYARPDHCPTRLLPVNYTAAYVLFLKKKKRRRGRLQLHQGEGTPLCPFCLFHTCLSQSEAHAPFILLLYQLLSLSLSSIKHRLLSPSLDVTQSPPSPTSPHSHLSSPALTLSGF